MINNCISSWHFTCISSSSSIKSHNILCSHWHFTCISSSSSIKSYNILYALKDESLQQNLLYYPTIPPLPLFLSLDKKYPLVNYIIMQHSHSPGVVALKVWHPMHRHVVAPSGRSYGYKERFDENEKVYWINYCAHKICSVRQTSFNVYPQHSAAK